MDGTNLVAARALLSLSIAVGLAASTLAASPAVAATVTVTDWAGLSAAMLIDRDTVVLGADIIANVDERLQVEPGETVTLDLSGRALTIATSIDDQSAVRVPATASLTIVDSVGGGSLIATSGRNAAGIGGDVFDSAGSITINAGAVTTTGGTNGAGIGGGSAFAGNPGDGGGGVITINGGVVTASGGTNASGIGGGAYGNGGVTVINGGTVIASAGLNAAGIGGGDANFGGGDGGVITINGGTVTANGGSFNGPGIGGGTRGGDGGTITINGGSVTAVGGSGAAGIGTGARGGDGGTITITAGEVIATGGTAAAGIGGGRSGGNGAVLSISGGRTTATGGLNATSGGGAGVGTGTEQLDLLDPPLVGTAQLLGTLSGPLGTGGNGATGTDAGNAPGVAVTFTVVASAGRFVTVTTTDGAPPLSGAAGAVSIEYAFDVTLDQANGSTTTLVRVDAETPVAQPPLPTREGFTFDGWRLGSATGPVFAFTTPITGPITLVAAWRPTLAETGADAQPWSGLALGLLLTGGVLLAVARRRHATNRVT
ncbi:MAG: hypothetical protein RLZZ608_906 [Actinomycetota bacterium]|jgi:uncharacterized repeat protein (TIGR02543 family)/LPXTG-motif cell wall-anchored protein